MEPMPSATDGGDRSAAPSGLSASQRRAELRRRKLLMNSEQRINRIMGFHRPGSGAEEENQTKSKPLDSDILNPLGVPSVSKRVVLGDSVDGGVTDYQPSGGADIRGAQLGDKLDSFIKAPECSSKDGVELRQRNRGDLTADSAPRGSHHGLEQYLSRFEEAMKLRKQLISEKPSQEDGRTTEEFDSFRIFRLVGCALLALVVRAFVCKYLICLSCVCECFAVYSVCAEYLPIQKRVTELCGTRVIGNCEPPCGPWEFFCKSKKCSSHCTICPAPMPCFYSIFAPFLTLQLAYMGLYKYFPKGEKKVKTTVLTAALLLSGIPAEVINRSMDTYSKMGEVFTDLCVYFFTFIFCHEVLEYWGPEVP